MRLGTRKHLQSLQREEMADRIYLSPPNVGETEKKLLAQVIDQGWVAPAGPQLELFEKELGERYPGKRVLALNSGTSALHLSLILAGVGSGDIVLVSTFTFAACANVILYQGATPVFVDSEATTWNIDPEKLEEYFRNATVPPKAVIVTHLFGTPAQIDRIRSICDSYGVCLIEDAAEAVGSKLNDQPLGTYGDYGILSFNGNKIITTGGGGALILPEKEYDRGLHLATQANSSSSGYDHREVGYNYRLSNVLAGVGLAQLGRLEEFLGRKRAVFNYYQENLGDIFEFPEEPEGSFCNRWLTTPLFKNDLSPGDLINYLSEHQIETRELWKPLHLHEAYKHHEYLGDQVAQQIYEKGICLPSGSNLEEEDQNRIIELILQFNKQVSG